MSSGPSPCDHTDGASLCNLPPDCVPCLCRASMRGWRSSQPLSSCFEYGSPAAALSVTAVYKAGDLYIAQACAAMESLAGRLPRRHLLQEGSEAPLLAYCTLPKTLPNVESTCYLALHEPSVHLSELGDSGAGLDNHGCESNTMAKWTLNPPCSHGCIFDAFCY
jgi:hypothetical protein